MSAQMRLVDDGPEQSRREAYATSAEDPRSNRNRVVAILRERGDRGATCDEIEQIDGMQFSTAGAVMIRLRDEGWVIQAALEPRRKTRRGHNATVWRLLDTPMPEQYRQVARPTAESVAEARDFGTLLTASLRVVESYDAKDRDGLRAAIVALRELLVEKGESVDND